MVLVRHGRAHAVPYPHSRKARGRAVTAREPVCPSASTPRCCFPEGGTRLAFPPADDNAVSYRGGSHVPLAARPAGRFLVRRTRPAIRPDAGPTLWRPAAPRP